MELDAVQIRILGCLIEKERTTPDSYPLSTNALVNACNQSSNRDPVVDFDERTVDGAMLELRTAGLARTITGGRANKHRHVADEAWDASPAELAVVAVLFLRGPQTVGELRARTERMYDFDSLHGLERCLSGLAARSEPFVEHLGRQPGQKERRWAHLLGADAPDMWASTGVAEPDAHRATDPAPPSAVGDDELRAEVTRLRADVDRLYELLGESPGEHE